MQCETDETETQRFVTNDDTVLENGENESDSDDGIIVEIKQDRNIKLNKFAIISITVIFLMAVLVITVAFSKISSAQSAKQVDSLENYVLPNDTVVVSSNTNTSISGQFMAGHTLYGFASVCNDTVQYIEFIKSKDGFKIFHLHDSTHSRISFELFTALNGTNNVVIGQNQSLTDHDRMLFDIFWGNKISEHFVELSVKLGGLGYSGGSVTNRPVEQLHRFAKWIWSYVERNHLHEWFYVEEELEKMNVIYVASERAGHRIETMDELMTYSSDLQSEHRSDGGRSLLAAGNCGKPKNRCGNSCFGMCGPECTCWSDVCGDCNCYLGCFVHDYYCSCESITHFCCVNLFWVTCAAVYGCDYQPVY